MQKVEVSDRRLRAVFAGQADSPDCAAKYNRAIVS